MHLGAQFILSGKNRGFPHISLELEMIYAAALSVVAINNC